MVGEAGADLLQVGDVLFALVVTVSPVEMVEVSVLKVQGWFHENPATNVDALPLVLGGGQKELPKGHVARVQVHGTESRRSRTLGDFKFQVVGPELDIHDGFPLRQGLVAEKGPHRSVADFFFVVVGEGKGEGGEVQVLFAELFAEGFPHGLDGGNVFCEDSHDNLDFGRCPGCAHGAPNIIFLHILL